MKNLVIKGNITATSKKQHPKYKQENPTKTAYLEVDNETAKQMEAFGLQKYTSKDTGNDFFIVKFSANAKLYSGNDKTEKPIPLSNIDMDSPNVKTTGEVGINLIQGEQDGNVFYRIQAIKTDEFPVFEEMEADNPFA